MRFDCPLPAHLATHAGTLTTSSDEAAGHAWPTQPIEPWRVVIDVVSPPPNPPRALVHCYCMRECAGIGWNCGRKGRMQPAYDIQGRVVGGLLQACNATNHLLMQRRLEYRRLLALSTGGKSLQGTDLVLQGNVLTTAQCANSLQSSSGTAGRRGGQHDKELHRRRSSQQQGEGAEALEHEQGGPDKKKRKKTGRNAHVSTSQDDAHLKDTTEKQGTVNMAADVEIQPQANAIGGGKRGKQTTDVYCVCQQPWDEKRFGIECDYCKDWYHPECLGYLHNPKKNDFLDVDGTKIVDVDEVVFYCPQCELVHGPPRIAQQGAGLERKSSANSNPSSGLRFYRWCDVADVFDATERAVIIGAHTDLGKEVTLAALRWKYLRQARNQEPGPIAPCRTCEQPHHPRLPCLRKNANLVSPRGEDDLITEEQSTPLPVKLTIQSSPSHALILSGKYQSYTGVIGAMSKKWAQVTLDIDSSSRVIVPRSALLVMPKGFTPAEQGREFTKRPYLGVVESPLGGFSAYIHLVPGDESTRLILGRFSSKIRAARVYDVAARLQFGESTLGMDDLNFPDMSHFMVPAPTKKEELSDFDHVLMLAQQVAAGPSLSDRAHTAADGLMVHDWVESMNQALDQYPPFLEHIQEKLDSIADSVESQAEEAAKKIAKVLTSAEFEAKSDDEELKTTMRRYSRIRNVKHRPRKDQ